MASKAVLLVKLNDLLDSMDNQEEQDRTEKIIDNLPEKFRIDFRKSVDNLRNVSVEFLAYWETNESCQDAFREVIQSRIDKIEQMVEILKELIV